MSLWSRITGWFKRTGEKVQRSWNPFMVPFQFLLPTNSGIPDRDKLLDGSVYSAVHAIYKRNAVMAGASMLRSRVFSQADFIFQEQLKKRRNENTPYKPGEYFYDDGLEKLRHPWPGATSRSLLSRVMQDNDIAGNAFIADRFGHLKILQPDWVTVVWASRFEAVGKWAPDAEVVGYIYTPQGMVGGEGETWYFPHEVAHFYTEPDPESPGLGMPWWVPALREIMADNAAQDYIHGFFENGAQPGTVITLDPAVGEEDTQRFTTMFHEQYAGSNNAYKTVILGGGAQMVHRLGTEIGNLDTVELSASQETRICFLAGINPTIAGLEIAMRHGSFNMAVTAKEQFVNVTMRDAWAKIAEAFQQMIDTPEDARLWMDDRHIPYLDEDRQIAAEIRQINANALSSLISIGHTPESANQAIINDNFALLEHTGLLSVQLLPPGTVAGEQEPSGGSTEGDDD